MRLTPAILVSIAVFLTPAAHAANAWGTDMSDMWWTPSESGWGAGVIHQGDVLFFTLYVYGTDGSPRWYSGALKSLGGGSSYTFTGDLFETRGPYLGDTFNPNSVNYRKVGTATMTLGMYQGTLSYSVDGAIVTKNIERLTTRNNSLAGRYKGAMVSTQTSCSVPKSVSATFFVTQTGNHVDIGITILDPTSSNACTYSATYTQSGKLGYLSGSFLCTNGPPGTFRAYEIEASYQGFFGRYEAIYTNGCTESGRLGGMTY